MLRRPKAPVLLLAAALLAFCAVPVTAADGRQPDKENLIIHKLAADETSGADPSDTLPIGGITFGVYRITPPQTGDDAGKAPDPESFSVDAGFKSMISPADGGVVFTLGQRLSGITDSSGTARFTDIDTGAYLVVEERDTQGRILVPSAPFIVSVPARDEDGEWITDVHAYPKFEGVPVTKTPDQSSVSVGGLITWTITAALPAGIDNCKRFEITDALDLSLDYIADSVKVEGLAGVSAAQPDGAAVIPAAGYGVTAPVSSPGSAAQNTLTVSFTQTGRAEMAAAGYTYIRVTFTTRLNEKITSSLNAVSNKAAIRFTNAEGAEAERVSPAASVHTGMIEIRETDAVTGAGLNGAEFKIAATNAAALAGEFLRKDDAGNILYPGADGYEKASDYTVKTTTAAQPVSRLGVAWVNGLKEYSETPDGVKTFASYWLVETTAPGGYKKLAAPVEVKFDGVKDNTGAYVAETKIITIVKSSDSMLLPKTGGLGTILFPAAGSLMIGMSGALFRWFSRKRRAEKNGG
jgi:fimbrial isopeptide formation D2 family protein/LPXTG-motif cell wall-anchored protein